MFIIGYIVFNLFICTVLTMFEGGRRKLTLQLAPFLCDPDVIDMGGDMSQTGVKLINPLLKGPSHAVL